MWVRSTPTLYFYFLPVNPSSFNGSLFVSLIIVSKEQIVMFWLKAIFGMSDEECVLDRLITLAEKPNENGASLKNTLARLHTKVASHGKYLLKPLQIEATCVKNRL